MRMFAYAYGCICVWLCMSIVIYKCAGVRMRKVAYTYSCLCVWLYMRRVVYLCNVSV